jgi:hypothetical protein
MWRGTGEMWNTYNVLVGKRGEWQTLVMLGQDFIIVSKWVLSKYAE